MSNSMSVWCFAHGRENDWEAMCVDLDIAVQGTSFDDVKARLTNAVMSYAQDAMREDPVTAERLLRRRAPLHVRVKCWSTLLFHVVMGRHATERQQEYRAGFDLPCPA